MPDPREPSAPPSVRLPSAPPPSPPAKPTAGDLNAMWSLHRLQEPTFDDLTKGLCIGLLWCMALWAPMFLSALS